MTGPSKTTVALAVGFIFFWNSGFVGAEYGLAYAGPFTQRFWRYLGVTLLMFGYLILRRRFRWLTWNKAYPQLIIGILAHGVWLSCSLFAIVEGVPAGIVALIVSLQPITTGAMEGIITGQHTTAQQWIGLVIGFLGVALPIVFRIEIGSESVIKYLIPIGSIVAITIASLYQRQRLYDQSIKTVRLDVSLFYQGLGTAIALFLPALLVENLATDWAAEFIFTLSWLTIAVSLFAYYFMWMLIDRISATRVASLFYLGPPVTLLMAWLMFGDQIETWDIIGLVIIVAGLAITQINFQSRSKLLKFKPQKK